MSQEQQRNNQEDEFNGVPSDTWYITRKRDGQVEGRITLTTGLEIKQQQIAPIQEDWSVSPRNISIKSVVAPEYITRGDAPPVTPYAFRQDVRGVSTGIYLITSQEFGTSIFAKQEGILIFCKWTNIYYSGGESKGRYCELTYFIEVKDDELIPNWKLFQLGSTDIETCGLRYLDCFRHHFVESTRKLYRISQVVIPTIEEAPGKVNRIILLDEIQL